MPVTEKLAKLFGRLRSKRRDQGRQTSSLVNDVVALQVSITGAIGLFALGGLAWTSQAITDENLSRWATQWTSQLNELGAPLFVADPEAMVVNVERFVATYPEVAHVDWYDAEGELRFSVHQEGQSDLERPSRLGAALVGELSSRVGDDSPELMDESEAAAGHYRLLGPVWSESFSGDALMTLDAGEPPQTVRELLGFVAVGLDYSWYESVLASRLLGGSMLLVAILALSWAGGSLLLRKALQPLSRLQDPLRELAAGNMNVAFQSSQHHEIQNIIHTLEQTTDALGTRDRRLSYLATHDSLTGLLNRHGFVDELERAIAASTGEDRKGAVLFIDLDQFKYINDTCGHPAGDELLRMAARSIRATTFDSDLVARFGGDEFAVLARDVSRTEARRIGEKILKNMSLLTQVHENKVFHLQCSIGITMLGRTSPNVHEVLSQADIACHSAKANGRNRLEIYRVSRKEDRQMAREVTWVQRIRDALDNDGFALVYQPLLRISTGWTEHFEVLLRLKSEGDPISPDAFLPAAMRFGLMSDIDHWVLEHAIASLAAFRTPSTNLNFSINLSASVFENDRFARHVASLLKRHDVPPEAVIFEITEQTAVRYAAESDKQIAQLREIGCRFAIDDFGKGYSSFSYLRELAVDYLKIDGSFVRDLENDEMNQTLVGAMSEIARAARMETIAECVESAATLEILADLGIDYAQGHFISKPKEAPAELELKLPGRARRSRRRARTA